MDIDASMGAASAGAMSEFCSVPFVTAVRGFISICIYTYIWLLNTLMMPTFLDPTFFRTCHKMLHERQLLAVGSFATPFSVLGSAINGFGYLATEKIPFYGKAL